MQFNPACVHSAFKGTIEISNSNFSRFFYYTSIFINNSFELLQCLGYVHKKNLFAKNYGIVWKLRIGEKFGKIYQIFFISWFSKLFGNSKINFYCVADPSNPEFFQIFWKQDCSLKNQVYTSSLKKNSLHMEVYSKMLKL